MEKYKEELLNSLKLQIDSIRRKILDKLEITEVLANKSLKELGRMAPEDQMVYMQLRANAQNRVVELKNLESSPYFMKCCIVDEKGEEKEYYFAKHQFSEESIYSWVAPVAALRFENTGKATYRLPDGDIKTVVIKEKNQYMIVDGKVIFFSLEKIDKPRELIYQEHFTKQKSEFILPEIIAQMEKAQDQVIRASYQGPLVISGPAGSGKTTLALHRVAYLTQAPESAEYFPHESIIIFVQDIGTKEYFGNLLPGLGINNVNIMTFYEWAFSVLGIPDFSYVERYGESEEEKDMYEYQKLTALRSNGIPAWKTNMPLILSLFYGNSFSKENVNLFNNQKKGKVLDRFDLVILLKSYFEKYKKFETKREYNTFVKDKMVHKVEKKLVSYSLMVFDEFQNYLPQQLQILKSCLSNDTKSAVYVGDIAQQVKLGTLRNFEEIGEFIQKERDIKLNKVYRNTKNILLFIQSLGYKTEIPDGAKAGPSVVEEILKSSKEEIKHIKEFIFAYENGSIGILAKDESHLTDFKEEFVGKKNIHILTMLEAQGVEFDLVFLVGIRKSSFVITHHEDILPEHLEERKRMQNDLLYVALTRAITELHILGEERLVDVIKVKGN